jgi:hypothetical protein
MVAGSLRIIPCPDVIVVDVEHTFTNKTYFICPHNVPSKKSSFAVC